MKKGIHPEYGPATIRCGCGNSWETRATKPDMRIEVCSECHPFFTGEQRIVDTAGRVERFRRRFGLQEQTVGPAGGEASVSESGDDEASAAESGGAEAGADEPQEAEEPATEGATP